MQVDTLGRYRIEKELGRGAMGRVFLAYDPQIDRRVAIKTIQIFASLPQAEREQARERFLREARFAGKLIHPGIVTVFDVAEADGVPYLAMELIEGHTLDVFCRDDELLSLTQVVGLVASVAEALAFAHANGVVHRDIKPANLMRIGDTAVKIMDFGLAKDPETSITHDGSLLGTPNYMSPEQIRGEAVDGRSDLFSLGIVLYEMLTGEKPFAGDSVSSVLYRIVHESPRDLSLHLERVPPDLAAFLSKALAKDRDERFPDGAAFAMALRRAGQAARARGRTAPPASAVLRPEPTEPPAPKRSLAPWVIGAALLAAIAAGVFLLVPGPSGAARPVPIEATVRTEPPGLPVALNGVTVAGGRVQFDAGGPFGVLTASQGCREAKHRLEPGDAGREIVLAFDPLTADVTVDPGVSGASVSVNGQPIGATPATIPLDLCRDNAIEVSAPGFRAAAVSISAKATPLVARNAAAAMTLTAIPMGRLILPATRVPTKFLVDGRPAARDGRGMEITAGTHEVTAISEEHFVEIRASVDVPEGGVATAALAVPALGRLVVQTFPPDCRVSLKRDGSEWRPVGDTPLRREVAPGRYALRVEAPRGGGSREQEIDVRAGINAPVRVSFGRPTR